MIVLNGTMSTWFKMQNSKGDCEKGFFHPVFIPHLPHPPTLSQIGNHLYHLLVCVCGGEGEFEKHMEQIWIQIFIFPAFTQER